MNPYQDLIESLFQKLNRLVSVHPNIRNHGTFHWKKVAQIASNLAFLAEEPQEVVHAVIAASLIHDIGRVHDSTRKDPHHGSTSVKIAKNKKLLEALEVKKEYWNDVYEAVKNHTWGKQTSQTIARYVWDADRLCLMGFIKDLMDPERMSSSVWKKLCR